MRRSGARSSRGTARSSVSSPPRPSSLVASAVALTGGSTPRPGPPAQTPAALRRAAGVPGLRLEYTAQAVDGVAPTPADMASDRLDPARSHRSDGRRRPDGHDARPGRGRGAARRHRPSRRRDRRQGARPDRQGRLRPARGHPGRRRASRSTSTKYPPLFGGDQIASATVGADQNGEPGGRLRPQAGRRAAVRRLHRGPHRELLRDHARRRGRVGAGHPERDHRTATSRSPAAAPTA